MSTCDQPHKPFEPSPVHGMFDGWWRPDKPARIIVGNPLVDQVSDQSDYREVLGAAEGMKEDKSSWVSFFQWLRGRGLDGVKLIFVEKCIGMLEAV